MTKEELKVKNKLYRLNNPDYQKQWRLKNKDKIKSYNKKYREENEIDYSRWNNKTFELYKDLRKQTGLSVSMIKKIGRKNIILNDYLRESLQILLEINEYIKKINN